MTASTAVELTTEIQLLRDLVADWPRKMGDLAQHLHFDVRLEGQPRHAAPFAATAATCADPRCRTVRWLREQGIPLR